MMSATISQFLEDKDSKQDAFCFILMFEFSDHVKYIQKFQLRGDLFVTFSRSHSRQNKNVQKALRIQVI